MSNEYSAPPVLLFEAAGIGASVTSRRPLSSGVGGSPLVCACAADRTSKKASAPRPKSLPHRAIAYAAASRLLDIPSSYCAIFVSRFRVYRWSTTPPSDRSNLSSRLHKIPVGAQQRAQPVLIAV